jgi:hypothetical protein
VWDDFPVDVVFERTGERRYAVEVRRSGKPVLRMDPAPGFDAFFPHDMQHLIVEEQLGITDGIFGRLAKGGTAATFHPVVRARVEDVARRWASLRPGQSMTITWTSKAGQAHERTR